MALLTERNAANVGGFATGVGSTLVMRDQFDEAGDDAITRPSVLWGLGSGVVATGAGLYMSDEGLPEWAYPMLTQYGISAITAGTFSAIAPKGSTEIGLPSPQKR